MEEDLTSSSSSLLSILIPEDIIREYLLPYMVHLRQVDDVVDDVVKHIKNYGDEPRTIIELLLDYAEEGQVSGVHYLLSKYWNILDQFVDDALVYACSSGRLKVVRYFCELKHDDGTYKWTNPSHRNNWVIQEAAEKGHLNIVQYLSNLKNDDGRYRCDPSDEYSKAIRCAARGGHLNIVKYLCEIRSDDGTYICDPSDFDNGAIRCAAREGHLNIVKYLCEIRNDEGTFRCDPSDDQIDLAIQEAEKGGHRDTVNYLRGLTNN